jgi:molybdenum-dependent DNA-binding transcriptional regulator ModE
VVYSLILDIGENVETNTKDRFYLPLIYVVKKHGSLNASAKALGISQQRIFHWNKMKVIPDEYKIVLHKKYGVPYKKFFEQHE